MTTFRADLVEPVGEDGQLVQRMHLQPGDILVYVWPGKLTQEQADTVKQKLRKAFGTDIPVVVLDGGARLQVVNKNELENQ